MKPLSYSPVDLVNNNPPGFELFDDGHGIGKIYRAYTNLNNPVNVWVSDSLKECQRYFCHGHALQTYEYFGYTVTSGTSLNTALADEWKLIGIVTKAEPGDIVVWQGLHGLGVFPDHSARIAIASSLSSGQVDPNNTFLSSKNGAVALQPHVSLASLIARYGHNYGLYRPLARQEPSYAPQYQTKKHGKAD